MPKRVQLPFKHSCSSWSHDSAKLLAQLPLLTRRTRVYKGLSLRRHPAGCLSTPGHADAVSADLRHLHPQPRESERGLGFQGVRLSNLRCYDSGKGFRVSLIGFKAKGVGSSSLGLSVYAFRVLGSMDQVVKF